VGNSGWHTCEYFDLAVQYGRNVTAKYPNVTLQILSFSKDNYKVWVHKHINEKFDRHVFTSPVCMMGSYKEGNVIGGSEEFQDFIKQIYKMNPAKTSGGCVIM